MLRRPQNIVLPDSFKLYDFNSHAVAKATQMIYIDPIGKHFYK